MRLRTTFFKYYCRLYVLVGFVIVYVYTVNLRKRKKNAGVQKKKKKNIISRYKIRKREGKLHAGSKERGCLGDWRNCG